MIKAASFWGVDRIVCVTADIRTVRRAKGAMALAEERGLYLTMEGNSCGVPEI